MTTDLLSRKGVLDHQAFLFVTVLLEIFHLIFIFSACAWLFN